MPRSSRKPPPTSRASDEELRQLREGWQRCQADFANAQRRWDQERTELRDRVRAETLRELLPILDNFERAFAGLGSNQQASEQTDQAGWTNGFRHIQRQLEELLARHGLERIETVGQPFDPSRHEAIGQQPDPVQPAETVLREVEAGWQQRGRIVRVAKVIISTGPGEGQSAREV